MITPGDHLVTALLRSLLRHRLKKLGHDGPGAHAPCPRGVVGILGVDVVLVVPRVPEQRATEVVPGHERDVGVGPDTVSVRAGKDEKGIFFTYALSPTRYSLPLSARSRTEKTRTVCSSYLCLALGTSSGWKRRNHPSWPK